MYIGFSYIELAQYAHLRAFFPWFIASLERSMLHLKFVFTPPINHPLTKAVW